MKRVMLGSVIVIGLLAFICSTNSGITDPREAMTLPYRVTQIVVSLGVSPRDFAIATFSINAFDIPIALIGWTALSVLRTIAVLTRFTIAAFRVFSVPRTLVATASIG